MRIMSSGLLGTERTASGTRGVATAITKVIATPASPNGNKEKKTIMQTNDIAKRKSRHHSRFMYILIFYLYK
jgi:hypothetical protein